MLNLDFRITIIMQKKKKKKENQIKTTQKKPKLRIICGKKRRKLISIILFLKKTIIINFLTYKTFMYSLINTQFSMCFISFLLLQNEIFNCFSENNKNYNQHTKYDLVTN